VSAILHLGNWKKGWRASSSLSLLAWLHHARVVCLTRGSVRARRQRRTPPAGVCAYGVRL
jgi:hypothetical protein